MKEAIKLVEKALEILKSREKKEKEKVILGSLKPGETFMIGEHEFIVLEQNYETTNVISKNIMAENVQFDKNTKDYNKSSLKRYIEEKIRPIILENIGAGNFVEHSVALTSVDNQSEFNDCICDIRPITFDEAREYNDLLVNEDLPEYYWTITPWSTSERGWNSISVVSPSGYINNNYCYLRSGVRPFCILKSNIFVSKGEK
jgi:hypothetical protein